MADASERWWVIGSAAVVLHGATTEVADVDVLLSAADAVVIAERLELHAMCGDEHPLFRSQLFFTWRQPSLAVEFMSGFAVRNGAVWQQIELHSRVTVPIGDVAVFVPSKDELQLMLARFGRPKDLARLAVLNSIL